MRGPSGLPTGLDISSAIALKNQKIADQKKKIEEQKMHEASLAWFETQANLVRQSRQLRRSGGLAVGSGNNNKNGRTVLTDSLFNIVGKTLLGS